MHLTPEELLDLAEGSRSAQSAPHLAGCASCRQQLDELRDVMATLAVDVPEPSPLFWGHFSDRVREAVTAEGTPPRAWLGIGRWAWGATLAVGAAVVVVAVSVTMHAPSTVQTPPPVVEAPTDAGSANAGEDPSFSLLGDLAGGLDWESAAEAGMSMDVGTADTAVIDLTTAERNELQRLLREAMSGSEMIKS